MNTRTLDSALTGDDEIICGCIDLTIGQFKVECAENPAEGFDGLLTRISAGKECTACLLDLEYHYSVSPQSGGAPKATRLLRNQPSAEPRPSLKRSIYKVLDDLSPPISYPLDGVAPILIGSGIEQCLTVSSHSLLYEGDIVSPAITYSVEVSDAEGEVRGRLKRRVEKGKSWRADLTGMFPAHVRASDTLSIGLMKVKWRFDSPGKRGTARPQIEINARAGSCAVHTQRAGNALEKRVTLLWQPADQRLFLSIVNPARNRLEGRIEYPVVDGEDEFGAVQSQNFSVAANGATLQEIVLSGEAAHLLVGQPIEVRAEMSDPGYKMHVLCASPDLGRFSIDHL